MRRFHPVAALALLTAALTTSACGADKRAAMKQNTEFVALTEAASAYWDALRWNNIGEAGRFIADAEERLEFLKSHGDGAGVRISEKSLLEVDVSDLLDAPDEDGATRYGRVVIQVKGYTAVESKLESHVIAQRWHRLEKGWFLDAGQSESLSKDD